MKTSIIITCYNSSKTIYKAIKSCLEQTYKNIEIIVVNDRSTDNSSEIVKSFKDDRIKLITHEVNYGAGIARRSGINNITGDYTTFLDSDDYMKKDCIESLIKPLRINEVDIVSPGYIPITNKGKVIEYKIPKFKLYTGKDRFAHNETDTKRFMNPMLINAKLWDKVEYCDRRFLEDIPTLIKLLYYAKNVLTIPYAGYYYVQNPNSLVHSASSLKHTIYRLLCYIDIHAFSTGKVDLPDITDVINQELYNFYNLDIDIDELKLYKDELTKIFKYVYGDKYLDYIARIF